MAAGEVIVEGEEEGAIELLMIGERPDMTRKWLGLGALAEGWTFEN